MKTIIKNNIKIIIAFILGMFISGVTVSAVTLSFASGDVEHTKSDGTKTNVKAAINDLYSKATSGDATSDQLLSGKKALSKGTLLTGTMTNYSSSTAQSCTTANTSNKLYVKPANAGYYTANSSFNTNINYNPNKTVAASTSTAAATANGNTTSTTINLDKDKKVTIPAGYYSSATTVQNVAKGGSYTETLYWYGHWEHQVTHATYTFSSPTTVKLTCQETGIGSVGYKYNNVNGGLNENQSVTLTNVTSLTIYDGNYPEGHSQGTAKVLVQIN